MRKALLTIFVILFFLSSALPVFAYDPRYLFTDQEKDSESGLYNFDAREYNQTTGRFNQPDPVLNNLTNPQKLKEQTGQKLEDILKDPQALNPYSYARDNPIKYTDPSGQWFGEFFTFRQSWSSFQSELGDAAMYTSPLMSSVIDHPYITGAIIGITSGLLFAGATLAAGGSFTCGILCGNTAATIATTGGSAVATQGDKVRQAIDFTARYGSNLGTKMNQVVQNIGATNYKFSEHSIMRIAQKVGAGNVGSIINTLNNVKPFEYFHENVWKLGYYDVATKIFVAQVKSSQIITTISTNVSQNYINNLIK